MSLTQESTSTRSNSYSNLTHTLVTDYVSRCLTREERLVTMLYYSEGLTMEEIGVALDVSPGRARQILDNVLYRASAQLCPATEEAALAV